MSLVIAIRNKDRIVLGSDKQTSTGVTKDHTATKIWEVQDLPGAIMGGVGSCRVSQVIQYSNIVDLNDVRENGIDITYVINSLVPYIVGTLKSHGVNCNLKTKELDGDESTFIPNTFLFAYEDRAWMIWNDLSVTELQDYLAIGSGSDVANGALFATPEKNPFTRIVTSIDAAAETTLFVDNGVDILATKYYQTDNALIAKALGIDLQVEEPKKNKKKKVSSKKSKGDKDND